jgi:hypothetical protein
MSSDANSSQDDDLDQVVQDVMEGMLEDVAEEIPQSANSAPKYRIPNREITAIEVPMVVKNLDRVPKAFGNPPTFVPVRS